MKSSEWIDPNYLLPDRDGDYTVLIAESFDGKPAPAITTSRFNKRFFNDYWSMEKLGGLTVIGWRPCIWRMMSDTLTN
jgi:hypothetical protein